MYTSRRFRTFKINEEHIRNRYLWKEKRGVKIMNTSELKFELHQIIDQVKDNRILEAVYTILSSQVSIFAYTADNRPVTKGELDITLAASEEDIKNGRIMNQSDIKKEIKTWKKK